jgi:5-methylcytosine-specific restriction enzyme B
VASDGGTTLGIGRVTGPYRFEPGSEFPHRLPVEWLSLEEWKPAAPEGLQTTVYQIRQYPHLIEIERRLLEPPPQRPVHVESDRSVKKTDSSAPGLQVIPTLPGIPGRIQAILDRKHQVIVYGPPGTGKTHWARQAALDLASYAAYDLPFGDLEPERQATISGQGHQPGLVRMCAFHPAYGYEDFLEGYRPLSRPGSGQLAFERRDGIFKRLCADARQQPDHRFFLIVDEINRGDIPRIFGELLTVLEHDKRGKEILLPLSGEAFSVPKNVYLIGTMNTADRSIALLDAALRRRFGFVELMPDSRALGNAVLAGVPLGPWLDALNRRICEHVGRDARNLQVGHAYLMDGGKPVTDFTQFARIVQEDILPLLQEYCYEDYEALEKILGPALVDRTEQRLRLELFDQARQTELVSALLALEPRLATSISATTAEDQAPDEEAADEEENGVHAPAAAQA